MPAKAKAHPQPTNTITGNIMHNMMMDVCFKIRIKDRIPPYSNVPKPSTALPGEPCVFLLKHPPLLITRAPPPSHPWSPRVVVLV